MSKSVPFFLAGAFLLPTAWAAGPVEATPHDLAGLLDWLVTDGVLDSDLARAAVPIRAAGGVSVPMAVMAVHPPLGCAGLLGQSGPLVDPHLSVPLCLPQVQPARVWFASLEATMVGGGFAFSVLTGVDAALVTGVLLLFCQGTGVASILEQTNTPLTTSGCSILKAGSDPSDWILWQGLGGGFGTTGTWDATVLLK